MMKIFFLIFLYHFSFISLVWADDIKDVKSPVEFPANYLFWFIILFGLLAAGIFYLVEHFLRHKKKVPPMLKNFKTPWQIALEGIEVLVKGELLTRGEFKMYYSQLSDIIRQFFEGQYNIRAPEMTTEEFLWSLKNYKVLTGKQENILKEFLEACDLVKFADYTPKPEDAQHCADLARLLVNEVKSIVTKTDGDADGL